MGGGGDYQGGEITKHPCRHLKDSPAGIHMTCTPRYKEQLRRTHVTSSRPRAYVKKKLLKQRLRTAGRVKTEAMLLEVHSRWNRCKHKMLKIM